jgi:uncharacterized protein
MPISKRLTPDTFSLLSLYQKFNHSLQKVCLILGVTFILLACTHTTSQSGYLTNPRQENGTWINDQAELLSPQAEEELNQRIRQLVARTTAEIGIATLPELPSSQAPRTYALALFNRWGIGQRDRNNGVLVFIVKNNRQVEVITGRGLQSILPDPEVYQLIQRQMLPALRQGDTRTAVIQGATALAHILETRLPITLPGTTLRLFLAGAGIGLLFLGYVTWVLFLQIPLKRQVPVQGIDVERFQKKAHELQHLTLTQLITTLFNPEAEAGQRPWLTLMILSSGGISSGMALALGWQATWMPQPGWGSWHFMLSSGLVYFISSNMAWLAVVAAQQQYQSLPSKQQSMMMLLPLFVNLLGSWYLATGLETLTWTIGGVLGLNLLNLGAWLWLTRDRLKFKRCWHYLSPVGSFPQELTVDELEQVLTPIENLAVSMGNLVFKGWREASQIQSPNKDQIYLVRGTDRNTRSCRQCYAYTTEKSIRTVQQSCQTQDQSQIREYESTLRMDEEEILQTLYTCRACGHTQVIDNALVHSAMQDLNNYRAMRDKHGRSRRQQGNDSNHGDSTINNEYSHHDSFSDHASSYDFGGGGSDGGGASSDG